MVLDHTIPSIGEFTKIPFNLYFAFGICILRWRPNEKPRKLQMLFAFNLVVLLASAMGMAASLAIESYDDILARTAHIIYVTHIGSTLIKLVCCLYHMKKLRLLFKYFEKNYPTTVQEREDYKLDEQLKIMKIYNTGLTICHFFAVAVFLLGPLFQNIYLYYQSEKKSFIYQLPFPVFNIYDTNHSLGYTVAYLTQCIGNFTNSSAFVGTDLLLITCVHLINMNFKYLAKIIRDFKPTGTVSDAKKLKGFVSFHNGILSSVELVNEIFNISIFVNYLSTVIIICLTFFQLMVGKEIVQLLKFISFITADLSQIFFISIFGTEMITLSSDIVDAFMEHSWYDAHIEYQRAIVLPIAQRPVYLKGFKFFVVSMESFKVLISTSYQMFTLIKTTYVDE